MFRKIEKLYAFQVFGSRENTAPLKRVHADSKTLATAAAQTRMDIGLGVSKSGAVWGKYHS